MYQCDILKQSMVHAVPFECGKYHMPLYMDIENLLDMNMFSFPCIHEHIRNHSTALFLSSIMYAFAHVLN